MSRSPDSISRPEYPMPSPRTAARTIRTLLTSDGVRISAVHHPATTQPDVAESTPVLSMASRIGVLESHDANASRDVAPHELAFVVAHGFTGSWRTPAIGAVVERLARRGGVVAVDFRGHGGSSGLTTLGAEEVLDLEAAVDWARLLGYHHVVAVGFSMGASIVIRHAALLRGVDAVVSVSGPGWWFYRGTHKMRLVHWLIERRLGRAVARFGLGTRIDPRGWVSIPDSPSELANRVAPVPLLVVHGDADDYFPVDHARALYDAAREPRELWIENGFGHAEVKIGAPLVDRIADWAVRAVAGAPRDATPVTYDESEGEPA
jgi:pimeloyl-ACP methyl ester carboxylesterase